MSAFDVGGTGSRPPALKDSFLFPTHKPTQTMATYTTTTSLRRDGENYASGEPIELTEDEAAAFARAESIEVDDDGKPVEASGSSRVNLKRNRSRPAKTSGKKPAGKPAADVTVDAPEVA